MSAVISDATRENLALSLSLVEAHREDLVSRMEAALWSGEAMDEPYGQSELVAMILVDLLLTQVRKLVETGELGDLRDVDGEHRALEISGRHYSRFGDELVPSLRDMLGLNLPPAVTSAWSDTFWAVISEVQEPAAESPVHERRVAHA
jgi:hypothetical protein